MQLAHNAKGFKSFASLPPKERWIEFFHNDLYIGLVRSSKLSAQDSGKNPSPGYSDLTFVRSYNEMLSNFDRLVSC